MFEDRKQRQTKRRKQSFAETECVQKCQLACTSLLYLFPSPPDKLCVVNACWNESHKLRLDPLEHWFDSGQCKQQEATCSVLTHPPSRIYCFQILIRQPNAFHILEISVLKSNILVQTSQQSNPSFLSLSESHRRISPKI